MKTEEKQITTMDNFILSELKKKYEIILNEEGGIDFRPKTGNLFILIKNEENGSAYFEELRTGKKGAGINDF